MIVAIDLHNIRDGGGVNYIRNLLTEASPALDRFSQVHLFGAPRLLESYPDQPWIVKHGYAELDRSLPHRLRFVRYRLPRLLREICCDVLYSPGGLQLGGFRPRVTISRNMMPFRPQFWGMYPRFSKDRLRLRLLRRLNAATFRHADGVIFLSETARDVISRFVGKAMRRVAVIPHGVNHERFRPLKARDTRGPDRRPARLVYPSRLEPYKHQVEVVRAMAKLHADYPDLELRMCGPANPAYLAEFEAARADADPGGERIVYLGEVANASLPELYAQSDLLLFASSCENLPNILIEAMACGIPICSSDRSPMPEIAKHACLYFDPTDPDSIANAVRAALADWPAALERARVGLEQAEAYSWAKTARRTFAFLAEVAETHKRME